MTRPPNTISIIIIDSSTSDSREIRVFAHPSELIHAVGEPLGRSQWHVIDQSQIDAFADAVGDHEWIHVDRDRAAAGPYGGTIAHGFLTLSKLWVLAAEVLEIRGTRLSLNYGLDSVRFTGVIHSGSRVRLAASLKDARTDDGAAYRVTIHAEIEAEGQSKPVLVADAICMYFAEALAPPD